MCTISCFLQYFLKNVDIFCNLDELCQKKELSKWGMTIGVKNNLTNVCEYTFVFFWRHPLEQFCVLFQQFCFLLYPHQPNPEVKKNKLNQEGGMLHFVRYPPGSCNPLLVKSQRSGFLRKSIFSVLGGLKNFILPPKTLFGLQNPTFGGVLLLKLFNPSYGFGVIDGQILVIF